MPEEVSIITNLESCSSGTPYFIIKGKGEESIVHVSSCITLQEIKYSLESTGKTVNLRGKTVYVYKINEALYVQEIDEREGKVFKPIETELQLREVK